MPAGVDSRTKALLALIGALHRELHPRAARAIGLGDRIEHDLGFDSLARAELLLRVEHAFGVRMPEDALATLDTVGDLLRVLERAPPRGAAAHTETRAIARDERAGVPHLCATLTEVLAWHVRAHPDQIHALLLGEDESELEITYATLSDDAHRCASALMAHGVAPGDTVAIMLPTSRTYLGVFFGVLLAGAIPVPVYPPARPAQLEEHVVRHAGILSNAKAVFLVTLPEARRVAALLKARVASLRGILIGEALQSACARRDAVARGAE